MTFYTLTLESKDTSLITHILPCESDIIPLGDISFADLSVPDYAAQIIAQVYAETGVIIESIKVEEITEGRRITIVLSCDTLIVKTETGLYDFTNESSEDLIVCEQCLSVRRDDLIASITTTEGALESEFTPGDTNSITTAVYLIYLSFGKTAYIRYSDGQLCVSTLDEDFSFVSVSTEGGDILFSEKICTEPPNNCDNKEAVDVFRTMLYKDANNCPVLKVRVIENKTTCFDKCGDCVVGEKYNDAIRLAATDEGVLVAIPSGTITPIDWTDIIPASGNAFLSKDTITGCVVVNVINRGADSSGCTHECDEPEAVLKAISKCGDCYAVNIVVSEQATDTLYINCENAICSTEELIKKLLRKVSNDTYAFAVKIT